jgi:hypothetical protein
MQGIAAIAIGLLVVASIVVGMRLLVLHRRTGAAPELLLGGMLLLAVGVGYPLMIATPRVSPAWAGTLQTMSTLAINMGFSLLFVFTWRVFQPQAAWARALAAAGVLTMLASVVQRIIQVTTLGVLDVTSEPLSALLLQGLPVIVAYGWTAWESLRYHGMMRRRVRLGLADAVVCNRFLLWGMMALVVNAGVLVNFAAIAMHTDTLNTPWVLLLSSTTGLTQVVLLVLTFLPPRSYSSWVRARAAAQGA